MALNDFVSQLRGKLRRVEIADPDINNSVTLQMGERFTVRERTFYKQAADSMASDTTDDAFAYVDGEAHILAVRFLPHAVLTANDTNYATVSVWDGTTTYASLTTETTGTGDWVDNTSEPLTVSTTSVAADTTLRFRIQKAGSGVAVPAGVLEVVLAERVA